MNEDPLPLRSIMIFNWLQFHEMLKLMSFISKAKTPASRAWKLAGLHDLF